MVHSSLENARALLWVSRTIARFAIAASSTVPCHWCDTIHLKSAAGGLNPGSNIPGKDGSEQESREGPG